MNPKVLRGADRGEMGFKIVDGGSKILANTGVIGAISPMSPRPKTAMLKVQNRPAQLLLYE